MDVLDAIRNRRSTRAFLDRPVTEAQLRRLLSDHAAVVEQAGLGDHAGKGRPPLDPRLESGLRIVAGDVVRRRSAFGARSRGLQQDEKRSDHGERRYLLLKAEARRSLGVAPCLRLK